MGTCKQSGAPSQSQGRIRLVERVGSQVSLCPPGQNSRISNTDTFLHTEFEHAGHTLRNNKSSLLEFMVPPDYHQNITVKAPAITTQAHGHDLDWRPQNTATVIAWALPMEASWSPLHQLFCDAL